MEVEILAFGAHPDDVELCVGGILIKSKMEGHRVGVVDLTGGEMGSRGDRKTRQKEAIRAAEVLGLDHRECLDLGDNYLDTETTEKRFSIAQVIRKLKPKVILCPHKGDRHPDHAAGGRLVERACFDARLPKLDLGYPPYAPLYIFYYPLHDYVKPTFVVDITRVFAKKMEAVKAYESQFSLPFPTHPQKPIGISNYLFHVESRSRFYGSLIDVEYGEALLIDFPLKIKDPLVMSSWV
jgi:bacillithiol biosynthesis deacetylase BshB1